MKENGPTTAAEMKEFMNASDGICVSCGCVLNCMPIEGCEDVDHVARFEAAKMPRRPRIEDGFVVQSLEDVKEGS